MMQATLEAIKYKRGSLEILDQLLLPYETKYERVSNSQEGHAVIKTMKVRGAPAIAIVAALSLAAELYENKKVTLLSSADCVSFIKDRLEYLKTSRPTAVNLFEASARLLKLVQGAEGSLSGPEIIDIYIEAAEAMLAKDVQDNKGNLFCAKRSHWEVWCSIYSGQSFCWEKCSGFDPLQHRISCDCGMGNCSGYYKRFAPVWSSRSCLLYRDSSLQSRFPPNRL